MHHGGSKGGRSTRRGLSRRGQRPMAGGVEEAALEQGMSFAFWTLHRVFTLLPLSAQTVIHHPSAMTIDERTSLRRVPKPTAVPSPMGRRIDAAGLRNTADGIVMAGM